MQKVKIDCSAIEAVVINRSNDKIFNINNMMMNLLLKLFIIEYNFIIEINNIKTPTIL